MVWQIPVFKAEQLAGLEERIRSQSSLAYAMAAQLADPPAGFTLPKRPVARVKAGANDQPDLHYLKTLLVTAGVINKNDDAFEVLETWLARHSPEDKPFNYEHVGDDIIGHITGCHVVDNEQKVLADDTVPDDLPAKFHIITSAVLYKLWEDETLQERMDTILAEIAQGKWFVSMEAHFKGFDYLLLNSAAKGSEAIKVVARNKDTAFLSKHLRAYGGDGSYEKYRVCRLLRNITFSGKGLVRKPANPESIIFDQTENFATTGSQIFASVQELGYSTATNSDLSSIKQESKAMGAENTDALTAENKSLRAQIETLQASLKDQDSKAAKAQAETLTGEVNSLKSKLEASEQKSKASTDEAGVWKKKFDELQASAVATAEELKTLKDNQAKAVRVAMLMKALGEDEVKAAEMADKLVYLKDDEFKAHADYLSEKLAGYKDAKNGAGNGTSNSNGVGTGKQTEAKLPPQQTDKPAPMAGHPQKVKTLGAENDPNAAHADAKVLENVQANQEPALATAQADAGVEKVRASIAEYMADFFQLPADEADEK